jgi:hypothetical protein
MIFVQQLASREPPVGGFHVTWRSELREPGRLKRILNQTSRLYEQKSSKCAMVSATWEHNAHWPLFCNWCRSQVHGRPSSVRHTKNLAAGRALVLRGRPFPNESIIGSLMKLHMLHPLPHIGQELHRTCNVTNPLVLIHACPRPLDESSGLAWKQQ